MFVTNVLSIVFPLVKNLIIDIMYELPVPGKNIRDKNVRGKYVRGNNAWGKNVWGWNYQGENVRGNM